MTIPVNEVSYNQWTGNGVATEFNYEFKIANETELKVTVRDTAGNVVTKSLSTHYTVSGVGDPSGGVVTMLTAVPDQHVITIEDNVPFSQDIPFGNQSSFFASSHERAFDKLTRLILRVYNLFVRAIHAPYTDADVSMELPNAVLRANKILGFDAAGDLLVTSELPVSSMSIKAPCRIVTTTNISLTGALTYGGIVLVNGNRVLVAGQTDPVQNGIYVVNTAGAWTRAEDMDGPLDVYEGTMVIVDETDPPSGLLPYAEPYYKITAAEIAAGVTPTNYLYPEFDIRRYGALSNGVADDTAAVEDAIAVAVQTGGHVSVFFPEGNTLVTSLTIGGQGIELLGTGMGDEFATVRGSRLTITNTSGDGVTFNNTPYQARHHRITNLQVRGAISGALINLQKAPFFTARKSFFINDKDSAFAIVYAWSSHFFAAYDCRFHGRKDGSAVVTKLDYGIIFAAEAGISGAYLFSGCDIQECATGVSKGQFSLLQWDNAARDYTGPATYPATEKNSTLTMVGCQLKSMSTYGIRLGSGAVADLIDGNYFEGNKSADIILGYGADSINIRANQFGCPYNSSAPSWRGIRLGVGGGDDERKTSKNTIIEGNYFRSLGKANPGDSGGIGIEMLSDPADPTSVTIHHNTFHFEQEDGIAISNNGDRIADIQDNFMLLDAGVTPTAYLTGFSLTNRPKVLKNTPISPTQPVIEWMPGVEALTAAKVLTANDSEVQMYTADTSRNVNLPAANVSMGKRFTIINYDTADNIVLRDSASTTICTLGVRSGTNVDVAECVSNGTYWTVSHSDHSDSTANQFYVTAV